MQKYLNEAQAQLTGAQQRAKDKVAETDDYDSKTRAAANALRDSATRESTKLLADANAQAKTLVADAEKQSAELLSDAEERLSQIRSEREAVAGYFESLRGVLSQAEKVSSQD
jgi:regulator of protease activity HflC (stomatin/prohibitin superfamily)